MNNPLSDWVYEYDEEAHVTTKSDPMFFNVKEDRIHHTTVLEKGRDRLITERG